MRFRVVALLAGAAVFTLSAGGALAATDVLDQHQEGHGSLGFDAADYPTAQTFTAGHSGHLDRVSLYGSAVNGGTSTLTVKIETLDGSGHPTGNVLSGGTTTAAPVSGWFDADFGTGPSVVAGSKYAIVFGNMGFFMAVGTCTGGYAGGEALAISDVDWAPVSGLGLNSCIVDFAFRTYVVPAAVSTPTPSPTAAPTAVRTATAAPTAVKTTTPPPTATPSEPGDTSSSALPLVLGGLLAALAFVSIRRSSPVRR